MTTASDDPLFRLSRIPPTELYGLLGVSLFSQDHQLLKQRIRALARTLLSCQDDANVDLQLWQRQLGRAESVFSDTGRWRKYDSDLTSSLSAAWIDYCRSGSSENPLSLEDWAANVQRVDRSRLAKVAVEIQKQASSSSSKTSRRLIFGDAPGRHAAVGQSLVDPYGPTVLGPQPEDSVSPKFDPPAAGRSANDSPPAAERLVEAGSAAIPREFSQSSGLPSQQPLRKLRPVRTALLISWVILFVGLNGWMLVRRWHRPVADVIPAIPAGPLSQHQRTKVQGSPPASATDRPLEVAKTPELPVTPSESKSAWQVGQKVEFTGTLLAIHGITEPKPEFLVEVQPISGDDTSIVIAQSTAVSRIQELSDYVTAEDKTDPPISPAVVHLAGTVMSIQSLSVTPHQTAYRALRLEWMERTGEPDSRWLSDGPPRPADSLRPFVSSPELLNLLRVLPEEGANLKLRGTFIGVQTDRQAAVVATDLSPRAVEIQFPESNLNKFAPGNTVQFTGKLLGRVVRQENAAFLLRPILDGEDLVRIGPDGEMTETRISRQVSADRVQKDRNPRETGTAILMMGDNGKAAVWSDGHWRMLDFSSQLPDKPETAFIDPAGRGWIGGNGGLVCITEEENFRFKPANGIPQSRIVHISADQQERIWVCGATREVVFGGLDGWNRVTGDIPSTITGVAEDFDGHLWLAGTAQQPGQKTVAVIEVRGTETIPAGLQSLMPIHAIAGDSHGRIVLGGEGGFLVIESGKAEKTVNNQQGVPASTVTSLLFDGDAGIWFGTNQRGLWYWNRQRDLAVSIASGVGNTVYALAEAKDREIWVLGAAGLVTGNQNSWKTVKIPSALGRPQKIAAWPEELVAPLAEYAAVKRPAGEESSPPDISPRRPVAGPVSPRKTTVVRHPLTGASVQIKLKQNRESVLQRTGSPVATRTISVQNEARIVDLYFVADLQGLVTLNLVGYSPAEKVEYLSAKSLPGTTSTSDALPQIEGLIDVYRRSLEATPGQK